MNIAKRLQELDWKAIEQALWNMGYAKTPAVLTADECEELISLYADQTRFRRRIDMERHRFGVGEYQYFAEPLPALVQGLRLSTYPPLATIANGWMEALKQPQRYPPDLPSFLARCQEHGQTKPTPLLLRYGIGGYNCLHQDLYGEIAFPLQLTCFLSRREIDYTGGEFLLVEQRPRAQSRGEAIATEQGEMIIFATRDRPAAGARGYHRLQAPWREPHQVWSTLRPRHYFSQCHVNAITILLPSA
jgi:uncharacterized protein